MAAIQGGERQSERSSKVEIKCVVSLQVVSVGERNDASGRVRLQMQPDIEAVEIFQCLIKSHARERLAPVLSQEHVPHLDPPLRRNVKDPAGRRDGADRCRVRGSFGSLLQEPGKRNAGVQHQLHCHSASQTLAPGFGKGLGGRSRAAGLLEATNICGDTPTRGAALRRHDLAGNDDGFGRFHIAESIIPHSGLQRSRHVGHALMISKAQRGRQRAYGYHDQSDHLNTPRLVADSTGTTVWRWDQQEPFGNNPADEDPDANSVAFDLPLRLPGQRYDAETGLHYNYFRDYDPRIGRYIEADPLGIVPGASIAPLLPRFVAEYLRSTPVSRSVRNGPNHLFGYAENRALLLIDPLGLYGTSDCSYYEVRCKQAGGVYYCYLAPAVCENTPDGEWTRCTRKCLQDYDYQYCKKDCAEVRCIVNIHQMCWQECLGGGTPKTLPGAM